MIVYTTIFNNYDTLKDPTVVEDGTKYFVFSEREQKSDIWTWIPTNFTSVKDQRMFKIMAFMWFADPETLYIDGSIKIVCKPKEFLTGYGLGKDEHDAIFLEHREFDCIYNEADIICQRGRVGVEEISGQLDYYRDFIPRHAGLVKTGWIYRRRTERVVSICKRWWNHVDRYTHRDQIAWACAFQNRRYDTLPYNDFRQGFKLHDHERNLMIDLLK